MAIVKHLRLLTAVLASAAACAVIGTTVFGDIRTSSPTTGSASPVPEAPAVRIIDELAKTKFTGKNTLAYTLQNGETVFAWQIQPQLPPAPVRPRDIIVLVDTSASQVGQPLKQAQAVLASLIKGSATEDRLDIWTVNINNVKHTRSLTQGFQAPEEKLMEAALTRLAESEYASGAVDLKAALETVLTKFDHKAGRQQVILYLGDGESAAGTPLSELTRNELGQRIAEKNVQFFAVPLGITISANNLHSLAMTTGGRVVRAQADATTGQSGFITRLKAALDGSVLRADKVTFGPDSVQLLPSRLPPLRADRATLVLGKIAAKSANLTLKIQGTVADQPVSVNLAERLPETQFDHFFLHAMFEQWKNAPSTDTPAMLAADRSLAMASEQFRLYREEFVELGLSAITSGRLEHAEKLFEAALVIDPQLLEAQTGKKIVNQLRDGTLTPEKIQQKVRESEAKGRAILALQDPAAPVAQPPTGSEPVPAPTPAPPSGINLAESRRKVIEQEVTGNVEELLKRARKLKMTDPDGAYEDLKRQRDAVRSNDDLSDRSRGRLLAALEQSMRDIQIQGSEIKRQQAAQRERISRARFNLNEFDRLRSQDEQTKARIDRFHELMSQARYELAYKEAQFMTQERINRGLAVPPEVTATYRIGQSASNLREQVELRRLREDRYLMCMLQVEKAFVPYPDEPPIHFPPASVWRELTGDRKKRYSTNSLGATVPESLIKLQQILETKPVNYPTSLKDVPLRTLVSFLEKSFKDDGLKIIVREDLFRVEDQAEPIMDRKFQLDSNLSGMTLGSFLDVALLDVKASYIVRPEYIEITTMNQRLEEKVTRAFDVVDLIFAIPSSVNQATLQQNLQLLGSQLSIFGVGGLNQFGGPGIGGFGGGIQGGFGGGIGGIGGGIGGIGGGIGGQLGGGLGGGGLGLGGGGQLGGGQLGQAGQGQQNLGVGGGVLGATGGQLGQFGNLGGQFGIQGNDQSQFLASLIQLVVARGEWDSNVTGVPPPGTEPGEEPVPIVPENQLNSLGFYPPVRALVIRGSSRYHPVTSFKLKAQGGGGALFGQGPNGVPGKGQFAGNGKPNMLNPADDPVQFAKQNGIDPEKIWNEAFQNAVTDPELVVNTADVLFDVKEYKHTTEALKAGLRHGRADGTWAHEALTIALQESKASADEVERSAMSGIDLEPTNAKAYLSAAQTENDLGRTDEAVALCKRAAEIQPNLPTVYANALVYAEKASDVQTDVVHWASTNLLSRDWTNDGTDYQQETKFRVERIVKKLSDAGRMDEAKQLARVTAEEKTRDLVVELLWQGQADLDLNVTEPNGSTASATLKRTIGGGVLKCDILEQNNDRSEMYAAAKAFSGKYTITATPVIGRTTSNKATLKVLKYAGTDKQEVEIHTINLADPQPIEVTLDGGSRTELATLPTLVTSETRLETTAAPRTYSPSGIGGGVGVASPDMLNTAMGNSSSSNLPLVNPKVETSLPGVSPALPGVRVTAQLSDDRKNVEYTATPVFTGNAMDIPMPKLNLIPGGE